MSVQQDRLTFFGVLVALVVVVVGYLQLGRIYPMAGRADVAVEAKEPLPPIEGEPNEQPRKEEAAE